MNFNNLLKKDETPAQPEPQFMYTEDQLMARLKFFIGICLALTLVGIVFVVLYSIIFVTQPLNSISPIDQKFFEMLIPISTFLTGILSGIMLAGKDDKEARMKAIEAATRSVTPPAAPSGLGARPAISPTLSAPIARPAVTPIMAAAPAAQAVSAGAESTLTARMPPEGQSDGMPEPVVRKPVTPNLNELG